jgi:hypothetical protein
VDFVAILVEDHKLRQQLTPIRDRSETTLPFITSGDGSTLIALRPTDVFLTPDKSNLDIPLS